MTNRLPTVATDSGNRKPQPTAPLGKLVTSWLIGFGALVCVSASFAESISGRVVSVSDGDTLTVLDADHQQIKIRLSGIDAPYMQVNTIRSR